MEENAAQEELIAYLFEQDEVSLILKLHLHLEQELDHLLDGLLVKPRFVQRSSFSAKLKFLNSLGLLEDRFLNELIQFNELRNRYSHQYKYKLTETDLIFLKGLMDSDFYKTNEAGTPVEIIVRGAGVFVGYIVALRKMLRKIELSNLIDIEGFKEMNEKYRFTDKI